MSSMAEKYYDNAEVIRKKIFSMYKEMVDSISEAHFKPIQDEIKVETGKSVDMTTAIDVFKNNFYESIENKLKQSWEDLEVKTSLASLSYAKEVATETKKWRPTSADPEEAIPQAVITFKNRTKAFYQRQLKYQAALIEELVLEVEQGRGRIRLQEEQAKTIMDQIKRQQEKDDKIAEQIDSVYSAMAESCDFGAKTGDSWIDKSDS